MMHYRQFEAKNRFGVTDINPNTGETLYHLIAVPTMMSPESQKPISKHVALYKHLRGVCSAGFGEIDFTRLAADIGLDLKTIRETKSANILIEIIQWSVVKGKNTYNKLIASLTKQLRKHREFRNLNLSQFKF